jgi:hypothetical protein
VLLLIVCNFCTSSFLLTSHSSPILFGSIGPQSIVTQEQQHKHSRRVHNSTHARDQSSIQKNNFLLIQVTSYVTPVLFHLESPDELCKKQRKNPCIVLLSYSDIAEFDKHSPLFPPREAWGVSAQCGKTRDLNQTC